MLNDSQGIIDTVDFFRINNKRHAWKTIIDTPDLFPFINNQHNGKIREIGPHVNLAPFMLMLWYAKFAYRSSGLREKWRLAADIISSVIKPLGFVLNQRL